MTKFVNGSRIELFPPELSGAGKGVGGQEGCGGKDTQDIDGDGHTCHCSLMLVIVEDEEFSILL